ncbi:MAG: L,D-transpeptidase family protein [Gammaproteobacteria bacterium]|nr:L,D-transpeptidase family protein [Gammaproteobacteria bacterium]
MFKKIPVLLLFLAPALYGATYPMPAPGNDLIGQLITVQAQSGETINDIGDKYGIGLHEMLEANPTVSQNELYGGEEIIVPTQFVLPKYRKGIVINLAECRLYYFTADGRAVLTYPVGLGRKGWRTPTTSTTVIRKCANPVWTVPASIHSYVYEQTGNWLPKVVPPGPENPLGPYAMYLGTHGYLIHGTNQPWSIGKLISAGCIRLYNSDVGELYQHVTNGTPVRIIHQPYKAGWQYGRLYLEAHIPVNIGEPPSDLNMISAERSLLSAAHKRTGDIDWACVRQIVEQQNGMPEPVSSYQFRAND